MNKFENKILKTIRENRLIGGGESIAVGFSGGADSVCLLYFLNKFSRLLKIKRLKAVHINHMLRGDEALRDESFCRAFCGEKGIEFKAVRADVRAFALKNGISEEEAGRIIRYGAFKRAFGEDKEEPFGSGRTDLQESGVLIATAHHADDLAETVLLNLLRGGGLKGLSGIDCKRENIIRPLLFVKKEEILVYLGGEKLSYVTDSTNLENGYTRNRIRNEILPLLEKAVNTEAVSHLNEFARTAGEADDFIRRTAREAAFKNAEFYEDRFVIPHDFIKDSERIFRIYVIIECIRISGAGLKDWGRIHFEDIDKALFKGKGFALSLPGGVRLKNEYKRTVLYKNKSGIQKQEG